MQKDGNFLESDWTLIKDGVVNEHKFMYWLYTREDMMEMLMDTGFNDVNIYGSIDGSRYDRDAERLISIAHK